MAKKNKTYSDNEIIGMLEKYASITNFSLRKNQDGSYMFIYTNENGMDMGLFLDDDDPYEKIIEYMKSNNSPIIFHDKQTL
ncbi:hypothetical protein KGP26_00840 [Serratia sp. JSRIV002]|uniref:hypothetical protein n=1 Tax=Serratia sp. JSRIV002 TaxID=2831894 RepID=UPI001CBAF4A4|nr:hypothetical protein [Serratia sp. JSRIV002]UAN51676.1 hypothetical protein KGP26_00840 [Serratia sp. JSRIV002]